MNGSEILAQGGQYAVGLGTLALLNAGLAQSENRSGLLWFFISLPLGPIATFLLVFLDKQPEIEQQ
ncbi:antitermination protein NusB [Colwellia sp. BRX10-4]|uniref:antitermination protein NusB n=1 Tax=Colwellia sp. BRX10-4 TaxID=2759843 RepID=UPI0015F6A607|nr:antitermination protein NusB [Colwellia sp. BRX10-4]MBA6399887.1 antitermination protein NusB [Colwellia sp. BRX10-4]